jgi:hypothetical protein
MATRQLCHCGGDPPQGYHRRFVAPDGAFASANFSDLRTSEVRRTSLPRTPLTKGKKKQLSWMSRGKVGKRPPRGTVFEDGVEDREQLAHAGHQSHLPRLAGTKEPLVELLDLRVVARGHQCAHVQWRPHRGPAAPHRAPTPEGAGVPVEWGHSYQGSELLGRGAA